MPGLTDPGSEGGTAARTGRGCNQNGRDPVSSHSSAAVNLHFFWKQDRSGPKPGQKGAEYLVLGNQQLFLTTPQRK